MMTKYFYGIVDWRKVSPLQTSARMQAGFEPSQSLRSDFFERSCTGDKHYINIWQT